MSKYRRLWIIGGISLLVIAALVFLSVAAPHEQICYAKPHSRAEDCATYNMTFFLFRRIGKVLDDHNGAFIAIFTLGLFIYTARLWSATKTMVEKSDMAATDNAGKMERSIAQATRAATAMERFSRAMVKSANAAEQTALVTKRMFTATHPPALTIHDIDIRDNDKGGLTIHFTVENIGRSGARIVKSATTDQVIGGDYNEGPWDAPDLVGQQITEHGFIRAEHVCVNIVPEDIVPIPIALPGIRAVADMSPVPTPVQKELNFGVFLAFADESGTHDFVTADRKCVVPSRRFPDSNG